LEAILEGTPHPVYMAKVIDCGAARLDACLQSPYHRLVQLLVLLKAQTASGAQGMDTSAVQSLIGIDIPNTRHTALVEQKCLDRCCAPKRERLQMLDREALIQRL
jgi:hypothetical protein